MQLLTLLPVAAILVAGIRLRFQDHVIDPRSMPRVIPGDITFKKGEEMGWFEHGSTMLVLAPAGTAVLHDIRSGATIHTGEALTRLNSQV